MDLQALRTFVEVARQGSFTKAAKHLGLAKSTASQHVAELEGVLGRRLLQRTTRSLALTLEGEELFQRGLDIVTAAAEAELAISRDTQEVVGKVRMSAPVSLGSRYLGAVVAGLLSSYPQIELEIDLSDASADLVSQRYDLALRVGALDQIATTVRKIRAAKRLVVGSSCYLEQRGEPQVVADLKSHRCLLFAYQRSPQIWTFEEGRKETKVRVKGPVVSDNGDLLATIAQEGGGLAWLPDFIVLPMMQTGRLKAVLQEYCPQQLPIHLLFPTRHFIPARVRVVAEAVVNELRLRAEGT